MQTAISNGKKLDMIGTRVKRYRGLQPARLFSAKRRQPGHSPKKRKQHLRSPSAPLRLYLEQNDRRWDVFCLSFKVLTWNIGCRKHYIICIVLRFSSPPLTDCTFMLSMYILYVQPLCSPNHSKTILLRSILDLTYVQYFVSHKYTLCHVSIITTH